jgi:hypothetical protein
MLHEKISKAAGKGVPLVLVRTADMPEAVRGIAAGLGALSPPVPVVAWDLARGPRAANQAGEHALALLTQDDPPSALIDPGEVLVAAARMPQRSVLVMSGAHRVLDGSPAAARAAAAILALRDDYASTTRVLVLLAPSCELPVELAGDVYVVDEALPDEAARAAIATELLGEANVAADDATIGRVVRSTRGLPAFAVAQTIALATQPGAGLDEADLHARWIEAVNTTQGLTVDLSGYTLADVAGLGSFKTFVGAVAAGKNPPDTIVRIDEGEKAFAGAFGGSDSSGVSQGIFGQLLTFMEEENATGLIAYGPPGAGKSLCSVAMGAACNAPTISLDVGALKGSLVGQSEERARNALRTVKSFAGRTFWILTCNSDAQLPPELRRRFKMGTWFFDLPNGEERAALVAMYSAKYGVPATDWPERMEGWSGAEIRNCAELAAQLSLSPRQAAQWIVPVAQSAADRIEALRASAAGKYLSASEGGPYVYRGPATQVTAEPAAAGKRSFGKL